MSGIKKDMILRFSIIYVLMVLGLFVMLFKMYKTMAIEGDFWRKLGERQTKMKIEYPNRGNILADDGKLLASSVPSYVLYMDFRADKMTKELFDSCVGPLSDSLATLYNEPSTVLKSRLTEGYRRGSRYYKLSKKKVSYVQLKKAKTFPMYDKGANVGGLVPHEQVGRKYPFGEAAMDARTIGSLYFEKDKGGKCGIEQSYDSILAGKTGLSQTVYVGQRAYQIPIEEPVEGLDVMTTLDVKIMDITDNALRKTMSRVQAVKGCAVVMEVETGKIRAMSNLKRTIDGTYVEGENYAVASQTEPGSTFKIASAIVALENGIDTSHIVDTENGRWRVYGHEMKDWNHDRPGQNGKMTLNRGIQISSNIVIAKIIEEKFKDCPEKYIDALYNMGLNTPMNIELNGVAKPYIKNPKTDKSWSKMSLPWISHGYELKLPPLNLLAFYNSIANNGKFIEPYLVKGLCKNGKMIEDKEHVNVITNNICSQKTLKKVQQMMIDVVEKGTAKNVHSENFLIAGKTGTAVQNFNGMRKHQLTFCGYFPAEAPKYSCVVVVWYPMAPIYPSAGGISGEVFKNIAEQVYAQSPLTRKGINQLGASVIDQDHNFTPATKSGNAKDLKLALSRLDVDYAEIGQIGNWCITEATDKKVKLQNRKRHQGRVPNVKDMGARDAVYLMENEGLKVKINGVGTVKEQSVKEGTAVTKGETVILTLRQ